MELKKLLFLFSILLLQTSNSKPTIQPTTSVTTGTCCNCQWVIKAPGCKSDALCTNRVCSVDNYCCTTTWHDGCAERAANICKDSTATFSTSHAPITTFSTSNEPAPTTTIDLDCTKLNDWSFSKTGMFSLGYNSFNCWITTPSPCIKITGSSASNNWMNQYIEQIIDVSGWTNIQINYKFLTKGFSSNDGGYIETICGSHTYINNQINMGYNGQYEGSLDLSGQSCSQLTVRIGGNMDDYNKRMFINQVTIFDDTHVPSPPIIDSFITCTSISNDNETCIIDVNDNVAYPGGIICDPLYPNCIVNCAPYFGNTMLKPYGCHYPRRNTVPLHCPSDDCFSCVVTGSTVNLMIKGYNCELLQFTDSFHSSDIIFAPANGGNFVMMKDLGLSSVYSSYDKTGTGNMIFHAIGSKQNHIDGRYASGDLNISCHGLQFCYNTTIICGRMCNINCSSEFVSPGRGYYKDYAERYFYNTYGACSWMTVYAVNGTSNVNWHCRSDLHKECYGSKLLCGDQTNPKRSTKKWDSVQGWYYDSPDCVADFTGLPDLSCQYTTGDTCIIIRDTYPDYSRDLFCDPQYPYCQITMSGSPYINGVVESVIKCPNETCISCVIDCEDPYTCDSVTIQGYNCELLKVNIRSSNQKNMSIYAPGNDGELILVSEFVSDFVPDFYNSRVFSKPGTKNIDLRFGGYGLFHNNIINGTFVTNYLNVSCIGVVWCAYSQIICPNDAACFIDCSSTNIASVSLSDDGAVKSAPNVEVKDAECSWMTVIAIEGTHDVHWTCNDDSIRSCKTSILECANGTSEWIYNYNISQWEFDDIICVDPPTEAPTFSPTLPSVSPTIQPSLAPTFSPTVSPTTSPIYLYEKLGIENKEQFYGSIIGFIMAVLLCLGCLGWFICYYKYIKPKKMREKQTMKIKNACVILICIGEYDNDVSKPEIDGHLNDLDNQQDGENMVKLFHHKLQYDIFPQYDSDSDGRIYFEPNWKVNDLQTFLEERANYLEENINNGKSYDGLIVVISCHGVNKYICTSDYKKFSKETINRIFSWKHPLTRSIPRFFLYDCCSGSYIQEFDQEDDEQQRTVTGKYGKGVEDIDVDGARRQPWVPGQDNPDYKLAILEASNSGFQAIFDTSFGSYTIKWFYEKCIENLSSGNIKFIHEIVDEMQEELHSDGKQLIVSTWNNGTGYIKFDINDSVDTNDVRTTDFVDDEKEEIEMQITKSISPKNSEKKIYTQVPQQFS
eukprot:441295_1